MKTRAIIFAGLSCFVLACATVSAGQSHADHHMHRRSFDELVTAFDSPERDRWQKPEAVVQFVEAEAKRVRNQPLAKLTLADLGAGSGYFSFRFLKAGGRVLALDIDERFIALLNKRGSTQAQAKNFEARHISSSSAGLKAGEVDVLVSVDVYHHIEDRVQYFSQLRQGLSAKGFLVIIDFKDGELPVGPPPHIKVARAQIEEELRNAGYTVTVNGALLPYQNIYTAVPR